MITLKKFQSDAISELYSSMEDDKKTIILESGTGSGKTVILTNFINEYMNETPNMVTIWFSPGKGDLEEQSKEKMEKYFPNSNTKTLQDILNMGFNEGDAVFINWELVTKKGNKALSDGERRNLSDMISLAKDSGLKFLVIIDEEHLNKTVKSYDIVEMFTPEKIIRASATPKKDANAVHITIPEEKVIQAGLIKSRLVINENIGQEVEMTNQVDYLLDLALKKHEQLKDEFVKTKANVNPLIVIQIPNKSDELIASVENYLEANGLTYLNGQLAVWLSDKKENLDNIQNNTSPVKAIIIKQAVATGWDCPRAHILVKLRENMSETFEIQTIGRIRRMPEAKHYYNPILDSCYLYTFDEKFKEGVKQYLSDSAYEGMTLMLKSEFRDFTLKKEKVSSLQYEISPIHTLKALNEFFKIEYDTKDNKFNDNIIKLKSYDYNFDKDINLRTYAGEVTTIHRKDIAHLNTVTVKMLLDTHEHGRMFHQAISRIGRSIGVAYDSMSTIIRRLFCNEPSYQNKILNLEPKELYAFIINNADRLEKDLKIAISHEKYQHSQLTFTHNDLESDFIIPPQVLFTYNAKVREFENYSKNVYDGYISSAEPRSQGEKVFERYCEEYTDVEWFYKNGDKGNEFFSIIYQDNTGKKHLFYPDYIVKIKGEIWIVEVKGGMSADGKNEDIDIFSEKKMIALMDYVKRYNLKGGFVRYNKSDMRLYINTTSYIEDLNDTSWQRIDKYFK